MADYETERRSVYGNFYLKVFLRNNEKLETVQKLLNDLQSIKRVNITENVTGTDLTIYPARLYEIEETEEEVISQLDSFFEERPLDPCFIDEQLSDISDEAYSQIISKINTFGCNMEKLSSLKSKFDEEGYRDYFLPHLNSISTSHTATGETFNKIGKTDILIQNGNGENVFIGECKIWRGKQEFLKAINQLLERYVNWRDEHAALIIFNKDNQNFSQVIEIAKDAIKGHPNYDSYIKDTSSTSFSYIFKNAEETSKKVKLELIFFNCY